MERAQVSRLEQERTSRGWTQEDVAERLNVDPATYGRWERGVHKPQPIHRQQLCDLFGKTAQELGLADEPAPSPNPAVVLVVPKVSDAYTAFQAENLTTRLQSLVWSWLLRSPPARYHELQTAILRALEPKDTHHMNDDAISRRDAIRCLASLPIDYCGLTLFGSVILRPIDEILTTCAAGIAACWSLRKGKDLAFVFDAISRYIPTLQEIVTTSSTTQRKDAAELLAQCFLLKAVLALTLTTATDAIRYAEQAECYGIGAKNLLLQVSALRTKATAHSRANQWKQDLYATEQAKFLLEERERQERQKQKSVFSSPAEEPLPKLLASYVYAGLAAYQGDAGRKGDALLSLKKAHKTFFERPADEVVPLWIDHNIGNLLRCEGEMYISLGMYEEAVDVFEPIDTQYAQDTTIPLTCRVDSLYQQIIAEVSRDPKERRMDWCIERWGRVIDGAETLQGSQPLNKVIQAYTALCVAWPGEPRVKELRERIAHS